MLAVLGADRHPADARDDRLAGRTPDSAVSWWLPLLGLGVVTAGLAYCTGIAASRRLGSRLASFVALLEVVAGVAFAWLLLDQLPGALQLAGGALIVAGVSSSSSGSARPHPAAGGANRASADRSRPCTSTSGLTRRRRRVPPLSGR